MHNVIQLTVPSRILPLEARVTALLASFATERRQGDDVFWLKENAELLNILECTGTPVPAEALSVHAAFYANAEKRLRFFPQYYRFFLSLALDLEAHGMPGDLAERMVHFAHQSALPDAELSDLQRAEARRLMLRRNVDPIRDPGLDDRLLAFASRTATFALPNKKAAYELTHIVYYLSEYGKKPTHLGVDVTQSLHYAGLTAFLDQNADLLAEICIALVYLGEQPPSVWTDWLAQETRAFTVEEGPHVPIADHYHEFLVCNWHAALSGHDIFHKPVSADRMRFERGPRDATALRELSEVMLGLEGARVADFDVMRRRMAPQLSETTLDTLHIASQSSTHFDAFFEGFARAGRA